MAVSDDNKVAVLLGPTAVGKTAIALELALRLGAEIVNADSLQVYRELDIGTAKPSPAERRRVPHHLVDVAAPPEPYDAARYSREGRTVLAALHARGIPPLVVGGSGLYLKSLLYGLLEEGSPRGEIRRRLQRELGDLGPLPLHRRLAALDPITVTACTPTTATASSGPWRLWRPAAGPSRNSSRPMALGTAPTAS